MLEVEYLMEQMELSMFRITSLWILKRAELNTKLKIRVENIFLELV